MTADLLTPAAQYLRMSTEHQQYSLDNQRIAIQAYADAHRFQVVQTYTDEGKSGVVLKHRNGLRQLLQDVMGAKVEYKAILVYDVRRTTLLDCKRFRPSETTFPNNTWTRNLASKILFSEPPTISLDGCSAHCLLMPLGEPFSFRKKIITTIEIRKCWAARLMVARTERML